MFLLLTINSYGQVEKRKNYFPIWSFHQKNINIHGISIGIGTVRTGPRYTNTNGIKIEIIGAGIAIPLIPQSPVAKDDSSFIALSKEPISERINGISLSATGTACDCITNGINIGFIGNINYQVNGLTASLLMNFAQKHNGLQFAMFNEAYYMTGLQIGLFNKSDKSRGIQIGLWNINQKRKLPLINWNFKRNPE